MISKHKESPCIRIGNHVVGDKRVFVIAEIGNNHNGSLARAIEMVDQAREFGADCVKFQMRDLAELYRKRSIDRDGQDLGTEYILDLLDKFELSLDDHIQISNHCKKNNILYLCTPWDTSSVEKLESLGVPAYKVASADLTNFPLIERICLTEKPLILSTGMSTRGEIEAAANFIRKKTAQFALLHCNSTYPAPLHDINLGWLAELSKIHHIVGYSGHERGIAVSLGAVALGAKIIERHFTQNREMEGPDHAASLEADEFARLINGIRDLEEALGDGHERKVSQGEMINRENLGKSIVAASPLLTGTMIQRKHLKIRSPGQGLSPNKITQLLGKTISRDMSEEDFFYESDLEPTSIKPKKFKFNRPWGIPIRYHDFETFYERVKPDLFEFHLSYLDMKLDPSEFLSGIYPSQLVVHAPELFEDSELLDLASPNKAYRMRSVKNMQRVVDLTRKLKVFFPQTARPMIIVNIGGFSMDNPFPRDSLTKYYELFAESLRALDTDGVEFLPQTMAPFPWHFGGQRYQNLFVEAQDIVSWCDSLDLRVCFDTSHSKLTCNHLGRDFYRFAEQIAPITGHLHIGDALGLNGEGLQVGEGEIDFRKLASILNSKCFSASFIPEIWQGHKNYGQGFWKALDLLEGIF